jgi:hypothetical protein
MTGCGAEEMKNDEDTLESKVRPSNFFFAALVRGRQENLEAKLAISWSPPALGFVRHIEFIGGRG